MIFISNNNLIFKALKERIKEVYVTNNKPFVVGFSGGKDSTLTTQLVFEALSELDRNLLKNQVYIISSDTLVETPPIYVRIRNTLERIELKAKELNLPISTHLVHPLISQSFWANIIGRGYPVPNQTFRWCTDRMKIEPANRFIKDVVSKHGEVIMLLGVREGESHSRDRVLVNHSVEGKLLMKHTTLNNAFIFAPIKELIIDEVWEYLLSHDSPWGDDNMSLYQLYSDSNDGECPLIIDVETKDKVGSCGNSRFGCWTCTVVSKDKSLTSFIESGQEWLRPLLKFRNWLTSIRDDRSLRMKRRTNGSIYFSPIQKINNELIIPKKSMREKITISFKDNSWLDNTGKEWLVFDSQKSATDFISNKKIDLSSSYDPRIIAKLNDDHYGILGLGPFTFAARQKILLKLLELQKKMNYDIDLISLEELNEIRSLWLNQGDIEDSLPKIYFKVFGQSLQWKKDDIPLVSENDLEVLRDICEKENLDFNVYKIILNIGRENFGNLIRRKPISEISKVIKMDYLHLGD